MNRILKLAPILGFLALGGCDYPPTDQPRSVADLGIATPDHPINNPAKLESSPNAPMQVPINAPAVSRATDAGANDEGGRLEPRE